MRSVLSVPISFCPFCSVPLRSVIVIHSVVPHSYPFRFSVAIRSVSFCSFCVLFVLSHQIHFFDPFPFLQITSFRSFPIHFGLFRSDPFPPVSFCSVLFRPEITVLNDIYIYNIYIYLSIYILLSIYIYIFKYLYIIKYLYIYI